MTLSEGVFCPGCLYGKESVDACLYLSAKNPFDRNDRVVERYHYDMSTGEWYRSLDLIFNR